MTTMTVPQRIQRRRDARWTTPLDSSGRKPIYVGRGSRWGNPSRVVRTELGWNVTHDNGSSVGAFATPEDGRQFAVEAYRHYLAAYPELVEAARRELAGRNLSCWCPLPEAGGDDRCHAAVLLRVARGEQP